MGFILKIYFVGLIAFVQSPDRSEMTVVLVNVEKPHVLSDGTEIGVHTPLLLARAGGCKEDCRDGLQEAADFLFPEAQRKEDKREQLEGIVRRGGAWVLGQSELTVALPNERAKPLEIPTRQSSAKLPADAKEARAFDWIADIGDLLPSAAAINPKVLADTPPTHLVAARLKLSTGELRTERLATLENQIVTLQFRPSSENEPAERVGGERAFAGWLSAEIPVEGCNVDILDRNFGSQTVRKMILMPDRCQNGETVEVALVNLPVENFSPSPEGQRDPPGSHFELYYRLAHHPPPPGEAPVPVVANPKAAAKGAVYRDREPVSGILSRLSEILSRLPVRGFVGRPICIPALFQEVGSEE